MTSTRRFTCDDLFRFNGVNLDYFTETVRCAQDALRQVDMCDFPCCFVQYNLPFYLHYLANWPEYCLTAEGPGKEVMGYILGKAEGEETKWHGHVTAVTVAPQYRCTLCLWLQSCSPQNEFAVSRLQQSCTTLLTRLNTIFEKCRRQRLAKKLMDDLEDITEKVHKAYFVDLFVRVSNSSAIRMYNKVT